MKWKLYVRISKLPASNTFNRPLLNHFEKPCKYINSKINTMFKTYNIK